MAIEQATSDRQAVLTKYPYAEVEKGYVTGDGDVSFRIVDKGNFCEVLGRWSETEAGAWKNANVE